MSDMSQLHLKDPKGFKMMIQAAKSKLSLANADSKPLAGTNITGTGHHQYVRLAIVTLNAKALKLHRTGQKDFNYDVDFVKGQRHFICFVESSWLQDHVHDVLKSPDWLRDGKWDNNWNFIEEITGDPKTQTFDKYASAIPSEEHYLWIAIYEFLVEQGAFQHSLRCYTSPTYGLPEED